MYSCILLDIYWHDTAVDTRTLPNYRERTSRRTGQKGRQNYTNIYQRNTLPLYFKQAFRSVYRHEVETRLSHKPWTQEISKVTEWPKRMSVAEFRLCVGHDCLGAHLHRTAIRPDPYCTICSLHEPMDRNHLGQCIALSNETECERYWKARTKIMEIWLCYFITTIFCDYCLALR